MTLLPGFTDVYVGVPSPQTSILWCWVLDPLPCMYLGKLILSCIPTPDFYSHVSAHKHMPACTHLCVVVEEVDRVCFVISPIWPQSLKSSCCCLPSARITGVDYHFGLWYTIFNYLFNVYGCFVYIFICAPPVCLVSDDAWREDVRSSGARTTMWCWGLTAHSSPWYTFFNLTAS